MSKWRTIKNYYGMNYITVCYRTRKTPHGNVLVAKAGDIERAVACLIVARKIPLRGIEVCFLRKTLGLSMGRFAAALSLSGTSIMKWEHAAAKRLDPVNEVAVRALMAEKLGLKISGRFSDLLGTDEPEEINYRDAA
jgi:DNA-binding transcriptional regulator YiaG